MGRKNHKKNSNETDNFYKYNPNIDVVSHDSPKYTFSQNEYL